MNAVSAFAGLLTQEDVEPAEVQQTRVELLDQLKSKVLKVFDTFERSEGRKDVVLCRDHTSKMVILRIGERRPPWFFPTGYEGTSLRIPRVFLSQESRIPFEVEEYIEGRLIADLENTWSRRGHISEAMFQRLLLVFWEFQQIGMYMPLKQLDCTDDLERHFRQAGQLVPVEAEQYIKHYAEFWRGAHPSRWKFATDNLFIDRADKTILVDNARVGSRYFGYDIGWLIWPRWVEMETEYFTDALGHEAYLHRLKNIFSVSVPQESQLPISPETAFDLIIFERLIGALYDVERQVRHFDEWGMSGEKGKRRRDAHARFLQQLLHSVMARL